MHREEETRYELNQVYAQFLKIGNNLNQIARNTNRLAKRSDHQQLASYTRETMEDVCKRFDQLESILLNALESYREPIDHIQNKIYIPETIAQN